MEFPELQILAEETIKIPLDYFYCPYWFLQFTVCMALIVGLILGIYMGWKIGTQPIE